MTLVAVPITAEAFASYGEVVATQGVDPIIINDGLCFVRIASENDGDGSFLGESSGDAFTDSFGSAGDDDDFIV